MASTPTPVLFIHGLWLHADSWSAWVDLFGERGYAAQAPGWPGDASTVARTRANEDELAGVGINDVVDHYAKVIADLGTKPIVIGHSFGGLIVQRLLGQDLAVAGVGIDAAPIKGVVYLPPSSLRVASVALRSPGNRNRAVSLTQSQFRYGFGNALTEAESNELFEKWAIPSPGRPLFEAATANFSMSSPAKVDIRNSARGPLLLTAGGLDHTVPPAIVKAARKQYHKSSAITDLKEFPDRGHSLCIDHGWRDVAQAVLGWLEERGV